MRSDCTTTVVVVDFRVARIDCPSIGSYEIDSWRMDLLFIFVYSVPLLYVFEPRCAQIGKITKQKNALL